MEPKDIRDLIELISRSNFSSFELEHEGVKIKLVKEPPPAQTQAGVGVEMPRPEVVEATVPAVVADPTLLESPPDTAEAGLIEVFSIEHRSQDGERRILAGVGEDQRGREPDILLGVAERGDREFPGLEREAVRPRS